MTVLGLGSSLLVIIIIIIIIMNHSINHSSQEMPQIDHPDVIQRIQGFHRNLSDLQNVLCNICKEHFLTISSDELGVCRQCLVDSEVPKLFSLISYFVSFLRLPPHALASV